MGAPSGSSRLRVRHVFAAAVVTIAACDENVGEPIDAEPLISENPPAPDAGVDASPTAPDAAPG